MDIIQKDEYLEKGFIIIKNIVPLESILDLYHVVSNVLHKYSPNLAEFSKQDPWNDPLFHSAMYQFRKEHPFEFGALFDTVQTSVALWRLGTEKKLCAIAAELMNDFDQGLSVTDLLLRMDAPSDTRNKLEWHQDSSYFRQNDRGENGCVCTFPMKNVLIDHGPLEVLPGSHKVGRIDVQSTGKNDVNTSEQFCVPQEYIEKFQPKQILMNAGDALFFNFDLIHRSGFNESNFFRFTAIARYHRMLTSDFKPGRLVYRPRTMTVTPAY